MRLKVLLSVLLGLLVVGCGGAEESLPADYRPVDVPTPTASYQPPSPRPVPTSLGGGSAPEDSARSRVERLLLPQVRQAVTTNPVCAGSLRPTATRQQVVCTVSYRGLAVPFEVEVYGGSVFYSLRVRQVQGLVVAAAVRDAWAFEMRSSDRPLSCDAGIPPATLVPMDTATPHRCAVGADIYTVRIETQGETSRIAFDPVR